MPLQTARWDSAKHLKSKDDVAAYLEAAFEEGDASEIAHALGIAARSEGMTHVAKETGLSRESLYRSLSSEGNPGLMTVLKVIRALGLRISVRPGEEPDDLAAAS
jgi:probable addiction module antidote protein